MSTPSDDRQLMNKASDVFGDTGTLPNDGTNRNRGLILVFCLIAFLAVVSGLAVWYFWPSNTSKGAAQPPVANSTTQQEDQATKVAQAEQDFQDEGDTVENRMRARKVAVEFVKSKLPQWTVKGVSAQPYSSNVYKVFLDIESGQKRRTLDLVATQYFPESGDSYWKADILTKSAQDSLHDSEDADILKQLNERLQSEQRQDEGEQPDP